MELLCGNLGNCGSEYQKQISKTFHHEKRAVFKPLEATEVPTAESLLSPFPWKKVVKDENLNCALENVNFDILTSTKMWLEDLT